MARTIKESSLDSRTARAKLKARGKPYWRAIDTGLHVGYRKGQHSGRWCVRRYIGGQSYEVKTLDGIADDYADADGAAVLNFSQAQTAARAIVAELARPAGPLTVKEAGENYVAYLLAEKKSGHETGRRLALHVYAMLGERPVADLTTDEILKCRNAMVKRDADEPNVERASKDSANRVLTMLRAALNRAFQDDDKKIPSDRAWRRVKPFKGVARARQAHLDPSQSRRLVNACRGALRNLVTAALLTGARGPGELVGLKVRDFRAELSTLSIVDGKTGPRDITLTAEAVQFFTGLAAGKAPDDLLLPTDDGDAWRQNEHQHELIAAVKRAKLGADVTLYTCRHSYASQALLNGMNPQLLAENMGTSILMLERHYGKFIASSRRSMIEAGAMRLGLKTSRKVSSLDARR